MESQKMKILTATMAMMSMWMVSVEGGYVEAGNYFEAPPASPHFLQQQQQQYGYGYQPFPLSSPAHYNYNHPQQQKGVPAVIPISPIFDVEVMKPMAQLEEQKEVTLYIVPQTALNVFPHVQHKVPVRIRLPPVFTKYRGTLPLTSALSTSPGHIPAVEIPLERPMVIGASETRVIAPAGFTVLLNGPHGARLNYPIVTGALLAPVPVGTVISPDTPVVLTTIYAVPNLPSMPSAIKILAQFSGIPAQKVPSTALIPASRVPVSSAIPLGAPAPYPYPFSPVPVSAVHDFSGGQSYYPVSPIKQQVSVYPQNDYVSYPYPASPTGIAHPQQSDKNFGNGQLINVTPASVVSISGGGGGYPSSTFAPQIDQQEPSSRPITNSKESPYLTQLREDSLKRQIQDLQKQLEQLQSGSFRI